MKRLCGILALLLLVGCASGRTWVGNDMTSFNADNYQCVRESQVPWSGVGLVWIAVASISAQIQADALYKMCMEARGYRLQEMSK